jgi:hypothetical protein
MTSLQRQLTTRMLVATLGLFAAAGAGLYAYARHALVRQFDDATRGKAGAIATLAEIDPGGRLEIEMSAASLPDYYTAAPDRFFELRRRDGSLVLGSPGLNGRALLPAQLPPNDRTGFDVPLPDGRPGRGIVMRFAPWLEPAEPGRVRHMSVGRE